MKKYSPVANVLLLILSLQVQAEPVQYFRNGSLTAKLTHLTSQQIDGLLVLEVTDGARIVRSVLKGVEILECENGLLPAAAHALQEEAEKRTQPMNTTSTLRFDLKSITSKCSHRERRSNRNRRALYKSKPRRHSRSRARSHKKRQDRHAYGDRYPLKNNLIAPGTKWCGPNNRASKYADLGGFWEADKCCRRHDLCGLSIAPLTHKYSRINPTLFTLSHCSCDRRFRTCLKMTNNGAANFVGKLFFNVVQPQCFVLKPQKVCSKRNWRGKCLKHELRKLANIRDNTPY